MNLEDDNTYTFICFKNEVAYLINFVVESEQKVCESCVWVINLSSNTCMTGHIYMYI
jgi:hypothetical protein